MASGIDPETVPPTVPPVQLTPYWKLTDEPEPVDDVVRDQMIYVTYPDPSDPSGNKTMLVTGNMVRTAD